MRWLIVLLFALPAATIAAECQRTYKTTALSVETQEDISVAYLQKLMRIAGCPLIVLPFELSHSRRLRLIENGDLDLVMEASLLPEREKYAWFSSPYRDERTLLLGLRDNARLHEIKHINDVARLKLPILAPSGGWFGPELERERQRWRELNLLVVFKDPVLGLRDLHLGRAQLFVTTDVIYNRQLQGDLTIYALPFIVHKEPVYIMFSKRTVNQTEVAKFNQLIAQVNM